MWEKAIQREEVRKLSLIKPTTVAEAQDPFCRGGNGGNVKDST